MVKLRRRKHGKLKHAKKRVTLGLGTAQNMSGIQVKTWDNRKPFRLRQIRKMLANNMIQTSQVIGLQDEDKYFLANDVDLDAQTSAITPCIDCHRPAVKTGKCRRHLPQITTLDSFVLNTSTDVSQNHAANTWNAFSLNVITWNTIQNARVRLCMFGEGHQSDLSRDDLINDEIAKLSSLVEKTEYDLVVLPSKSQLSLVIFNKQSGEYRILGLSVVGRSDVHKGGTIRNSFSMLQVHLPPHLFVFTPDVSRDFHVHPRLTHKGNLHFYFRPSTGSFINDHDTFLLTKSSDFFQDLFDKLPAPDLQITDIASTIKSATSILGYIFEFLFMAILGGGEGGVSGGIADIIVNDGKSVQVKGTTLNKTQFKIDLQSKYTSYAGLDYFAICVHNSTRNVIRLYAPLPIQSGYIESQLAKNKKSISTSSFDENGWPTAKWLPAHFDLSLNHMRRLATDVALLNEIRNALNIVELFNQQAGFEPFGTKCKHRRKIYGDILSSMLKSKINL